MLKIEPGSLQLTQRWHISTCWPTRGKRVHLAKTLSYTACRSLLGDMIEAKNACPEKSFLHSHRGWHTSATRIAVSGARKKGWSTKPYSGTTPCTKLGGLPIWYQVLRPMPTSFGKGGYWAPDVGLACRPAIRSVFNTGFRSWYIPPLASGTKISSRCSSCISGP